MNQSCHAYKWIMLHVWMGHVAYFLVFPFFGSFPQQPQSPHSNTYTHTNPVQLGLRSRHTRDWVVAHISISHGTHVTECRPNRNEHPLPHLAPTHAYARPHTHIRRPRTHIWRPHTHICSSDTWSQYTWVKRALASVCRASQLCPTIR